MNLRYPKLAILTLTYYSLPIVKVILLLLGIIYNTAIYISFLARLKPLRRL